MSAVSGVLELMPSQSWDGADGLWSTFNVSIGTPAQSVKLLPGTSSIAATAIWTVIEQGCSVLNPHVSGCPMLRGGLFHSNESTTWSTAKLDNRGLFTLPLLEEANLGLLGNDNAYYGFDRIAIGNPGRTESWSMSDQLIAGIATNDFWLGILDMSPNAFNFTSFNGPVPSLLQNMRSSGIVNSNVWAYTAGAWYRDQPDFGSLSFGGYDATRVNRSLQIPMYPDISRDVLVGIQSITYDSYGSFPLLASGIYAFLDSLVAQIWLPLEACQAFEKAFSLSWSSAGYYFVDNNTHAALIAQNPTITFTLGAAARDGDSIEIKLPYSAFDLNISAPYVNKTQRYFPLKRASDSSQYTLGRVFFQEAYIIADYDRGVFNISQALPSMSHSKLIAVQAPQSQPTPSSTTLQTEPERLSTGKIAGIVIAGAAVCVLGIVGLAKMLLKRRARHKSARVSPHDCGHSQEKAAAAQELDMSCEVHEVNAKEKESELTAEMLSRPELQAEEFSEMPGSQHMVVELPA